MRRLSLAAALAAPAVLLTAAIVSANPPSGPWGTSCGICARWCPKLHQHGPLFNYGPYYGYPPFEPYGPWNSYLQYNPWYWGDPNAGDCGKGCKTGGKFSGCGLGEGWHAGWCHGGWFKGHGCFGCGHGKDTCGHGGCKSGGCSLGGCKTGGCGTGGGCTGGGCKAANFDPATTDPLSRYAGAGKPVEFAGYYSGLPSIDPTLLPAGGLAK